jgi:hypothetical protein
LLFIKKEATIGVFNSLLSKGGNGNMEEDQLKPLIAMLMNIRETCDNAYPKDLDPNGYLCKDSYNGFCSLGACPLLEDSWNE